MLDRYIGVTFDDARMRVTVQAGCHLGHDPRDPTRTSTWDNSLLAQLENRGWALPDLGGVSHQTVSGFLMTGSCGGTVMHAFEDAVVGWRIVDGTGTVHAFERDGNDPRFYAVGCSLGLLGIVSTVTLQCIPRYDIVGREDITAESDTAYELFGDGERGLEGFFRRTEYARLMWWPQEGVRRVVTWQARRMREHDYNEQSGPRGSTETQSLLGARRQHPQSEDLAGREPRRTGGRGALLRRSRGDRAPLRAAGTSIHSHESRGQQAASQVRDARAADRPASVREAKHGSAALLG